MMKRGAQRLFLTGCFLTACAGGPRKEAAAPPVPTVPRPTAPPPAQLPASGAWAEDIRAMQAEADAYIRDHGHPFYDKIIILDPDRYDIGRAMGRRGEEIILEMLAEHGYAPAWEPAAMALSSRMRQADSSLLGPAAWTVMPGALPDAAARTCVVLPALPNSLPVEMGTMAPMLPLPGMDVATALEFFNLHETWHCKDAVNDPAQAEEMKTLVETEGGDPDTDPRMEALRFRREALTDLGALGDMIRAGREPGIISTIIRWRGGGPEAAYGHSTAPVLAAMEKALSGRGLPAFRAITEKQAVAFYSGIIGQSGLATPEAARAWSEWRQADTETRRRMERNQPGNPGIALARAQDASPPWRRGAEQERRAAGKRLEGWSAADSLRRRARELAAGRTPGRDDVIRAYVLLQAELRAGMRRHPGDIAAFEKAMGLRTALAEGAGKILAAPPRRSPGRAKAGPEK